MSTLLSFMILAVALCRLSDAAITNSFRHFESPSQIVPIEFTRGWGVGKLRGIGLAGGPDLLRPAELPSSYMVGKTLPYQAFPDDEKLQDIGAFYLNNIGSKKIRILSENSKAEWEECSDKLQSLTTEQKEKFEKWFNSDVMEHHVNDEARQSVALCVDWSVTNAKHTVWWSDRLIEGNRKNHEFMKLVDLGNLLKLQDKQTTLSDEYIRGIVPQLLETLKNDCHQAVRSAPLKIESLSEVKNVGGGPLYRDRIDQVVESLYKVVQKPDQGCKEEQVFEVLYLLNGDSPGMATQKADVAVGQARGHDFKNMVSDPKKTNIQNIYKCLEDLAKMRKH